MNLSSTDNAKFWEDGYLIIKSVFSEQEIELIRSHIESYNATLAKGQPKGDILSNDNDQISEVIYDPRIVGIAKNILGGLPVYFGDSTISIGSHHRGWHKDNRIPDRFQHNLADWSSRYSLIRFGIYLQDHRYSSGGLAVRAKSHNPSRLVRMLNGFKLPFVSDTVQRRVSTRLSVWAANYYGKAKILDIEVGDLVVWNQRTTHSGNAIRSKLFPALKMPKWLEDRFPKSWQRSYQKQRMAMFMTYGLEDSHLTRAIEYLKKRKYMVNNWAVSNIDQKTLEKIDPDQLSVKQPPLIEKDWVPPLP